MIDVLNAGCSKGHALKRWAAHRGFRREEVMAIGDNHNDVEMLEFAGHPVIMGNACEELRGRGWTVTLGNDECGDGRDWRWARSWSARFVVDHSSLSFAKCALEQFGYRILVSAWRRFPVSRRKLRCCAMDSLSGMSAARSSGM